MNQPCLCRAAAVFRFAVIGALAAAAPLVLAQSVASPTLASTPQTMETLVVTGSYLPEAGEVTASPLVTLDRAAISHTGATDALRALKTLSPSFSGSNNAGNEVNLFGFGESYVALRNLTTLVLANGRRMPNSPFSSNNSSGTIPSVDLNTIPLAMIERVEVLKDSASTVYGSDAVGGVINLILRDNYEGLEIGGRYGTDRHSDYVTREGWLVGGISRPRASLTVGGQYFESSKLLTSDRKIAALSPAELVALGQNPAVLASHISSAYAGRNGNFLIAGSPLAVGAPGYNPAILSLPPKASPTAPARTMDELVAAGYYIPISSTPLSQAVGGTASILNTALYGFAIVLPNERRQAFASGRAEIFGEKLEVFADFIFARTLNGGSDLAPSPIPAVSPLRIPANNPYNLFGVAIGAGGAPNAPALRTRLDEFGPRTSDHEVDTRRISAGLRGRINEHWSWETGFTDASAKGTQTFFGGANGQVLFQTLVPQVTPGGSYVYDTQGRPLSIYVHNGSPVPVYDYFGVPGANAPETIAALRTTLHRQAHVKQRTADARATGTLLELPAGNVSMAAGVEWRSEKIGSSADALFNAGLAVGYIPVNNLPEGERRTRAAFLETRIPLAGPQTAVPLMHRADFTAAIRHERISPGGTANTPKFGLRWLPFDEQFVVRATYSKGFIAPSIFALFGPAQGAVPTVALPEGNGQSGPGGATGRIVSGQFIAQVSELSNPALTAAKSTSHTVGFVYSPQQVKGLNFSADYYRLEQDKVGGFDYNFIIGDLNARGSASPYAANFRFVDGSSLATNTPNQVTSTNAGTLRVVNNPLGDLRTDGLDLAAKYSFATASAGTFEVGADANVIFNFKARANPASPYLQYARVFTESINGKGNPQGVLPSHVLRAHVGHTWRQVRTTLRLTYVPSVDAPGTLFGAPAGTPNILRADLKSYTISSYRTVDLAATYTVPDTAGRWARKLSVTAGVNNVFNEEPPFVPGAGSGVGSESNTVKSMYDIVGRFFFVELKKEF